MFYYECEDSMFDLTNRLNSLEKMYKDTYNKEICDINVVVKDREFYAIFRTRKRKG